MQREKGWTDAPHGEWRQLNPGVPREGVDGDASRKQGAQPLWRERPVQKEQLVPRLVQQGPPSRAGADGHTIDHRCCAMRARY